MFRTVLCIMVSSLPHRRVFVMKGHVHGAKLANKSVEVHSKDHGESTQGVPVRIHRAASQYEPIPAYYTSANRVIAWPLAEIGGARKESEMIRETGTPCVLPPWSNNSGNSVQVAPTLCFSTHYNMNHPQRGVALIFSHNYFFADGHLSPRIGTAIDCNALSECFSSLGFDVRVYEDLFYNEIQRNLANVAEMDHTDHDCLVVAVLTHGDMTHLYAHDMAYRDDMIWSHFTADKCRTLAGKPKVFFIQACQCSLSRAQSSTFKRDSGITLCESTAIDENDHRTFRIPSNADFLFAHSSNPGFHSFRDTHTGTWFIQALCQELNDYGTKWDLVTLLTFVSQRAIEYEQSTEKAICQKQIPCITSLLTRIIRFTLPKNQVANQVTTD